MGKYEEVCTSLSAKYSFNCEIVKKTVVHTYELVPEAYKQTFKNCRKSANQIFVEFASKKKKSLVNVWCQANKVKTLRAYFA